MALRARATIVDYFAYNVTSGTPAVGDGANHTVYILVDNNTPVQYTGTITEVDSTNMPGLYRISLTSGHTDGYKVTVYVKSSTSGVLIHPVEFFTEDGRLDVAISSRLPDGNVTVGGYATGMSPAEQVLSTPANKLFTNSSGYVTVAANNDKSGYSLVSSEHTAIASSVWSATTRTLSSLGNSLVDEIWHRLRSASNPPAGSFGYYLDARVSEAGGGGGVSDWTSDEKEQIRYVLGIDGTKTAPTGNTGWIPDIRAKTQQMTFTGSNINANISSYSSGLSPGEQILIMPSFKISTNAFGDVSISNDQSDYIASTAALFVWSTATGSLTGTNTIGKRIVDYLDTTISSRSSLTTADVRAASLQALTDQGYTTARSSRLDNLDVAVSTRLAASDYAVPPGTTDIASAVWGYSARTITDMSAAAAVTVWHTPTTSITADGSIGAQLKANIDATISSRLPASSYVAPPTTNEVASAVWGYSTRQITDMTATAALSVWHTPAANVTAANTMGLQVKTNLDAAVSTRSTVTTGAVKAASQQALTDQGYTATRAANLDYLDVAVSSRLAASSYTTPPAVSEIVSEVWSHNVRSITDMDTTAAVRVWHTPATSVTANNSIGLQMKNNIDATISSRSVLTSGDVVAASQQALTSQGYTTTRAGYLDRLDAAVSSRLATVDYSVAAIASAVWGYTTRELTSLSTGLAVSVWNVPSANVNVADSIGLRLRDNVDASISSRLAASSYLAPDNVTIASIWDKTQHLSYTEYSGTYYVNSYTTNPGSVDYNQIATSVWAAATGTDYDNGSFGTLVKNNIDASISSRLAASAYIPPPEATSVASAVWSHSSRELTALSTGLALSVWNVPAANVTAANSIGLQMKTNVDVTISSRLAASSYTAPDNAGISSIWNKVQYLEYTQSDTHYYVNAYTTNPGSVDYNQIATSVWSAASGTDYGTNAMGTLIKTQLDVPVSSRLAASSYTSPPDTYQIADAVWTRSSRELTAISTGLAISVWNVPTTNVTASNTIGMQVKNNLDVAVSTRSAMTTGDVKLALQQAMTDQGYTTSRAERLDRLDVAVSSRLASADYVVPPDTVSIAEAVWSYPTREITALGSSSALSIWHVPATSITASDTIGLQLKQNVDTAISSRLASSTYVTPDNTGISNIWNKVQYLSYTQQGSSYYVNAYTTNPGSVDYNQIATSVWSAATSSDYGTGSFGNLIKANVDAQISSRLASSDYMTSPEATAVASAVWSYSTRELTTIPSSQAIAVWNVAATALTGMGTIGLQLKNNVDVAISTRSTLTSSDVQSAVTSIGYTATRAANLDYLDASVSSRLASSSYATPPDAASIAGAVWSYSNRELTALSTGLAMSVWNVPTSSATGSGTIGKRVVDNLDAAVSSRSTLGESGVLNALNSQGYTTARASRLDNLDTSVSSRLAASSFSTTGIADAVWNTSRGTSRAYDTFGFYLDARISSISGGGGGGGGFYGPYDVTLQFLDENNNPVSGVVFFVEGMGGAMAASGSATINLPGGNFIVRAMGGNSVLFSPTAILVTGSGSFQIRGAIVSVPVSTTRDGVVLHYLLNDDLGNPSPNTDVTVTILDLPVKADRSIWNVGQSWTVRTNANGVAVLPELPVSALVELLAMVGTRQIRVTLRIPRSQR